MSDVYYSKTNDREGFTRLILEKFRKEFQGKKVLVKPNIVSFEDYPTTTHPDVLRAVIDTLQTADCEIAVADGPAADAGDTGKTIKEHHLREVCNKFGLELINLHEHPFEKRKARNIGLRVSTFPDNYDYIISLPVLKTHPNTQLTGALKNQFGLFANRTRMLIHARIKNIHKSIAELNLLIKPDLFIVDAVETLIGANEVRHGGRKAELGYMLGGKDPVALDSYGLELLKHVAPQLEGKKPDDVRHIKYAAEYGVGSMKYRAVVV